MANSPPDAAGYSGAIECDSVESAFATVLARAKDYGMPHVKLPIEAAEQVLRALRAAPTTECAAKSFKC